MSKERKRLIYVSSSPEGLFYFPGFLTDEEHQGILAHITEQPFEPYDHHGYKANREVVYFGLQGGYNGVGAEEKAEPMPEWLEPLRAKCANLIGLQSNELAMALVARYAVGAGIGWHRDRPQFGPSVLGVSFGSDAEMRFRRFVEDREELFKIRLERASAYIIGGPARSIWQHGMNPVKELRYSITFRTIKNRDKDKFDARHQPSHIAERLASLNMLPSVNATAEAEARQLKLL